MIIKEVDAQLAKEPPKTLVELCQEYKESSWFSRLASSTKARYEACMLGLVGSPYGLKHPDVITPRIADVIYKQVQAQHGDFQANYFQAVWHRIYEFAERYEYVQKNPWRRLQVAPLKSRKVFWTEEQVFQVIEYALANDMYYLALGVCLLYDTGQRPSDIMYLTYGKIKKDHLGFYIDITQQKRNADVKPALSKYTIGLLGGEEAVFKADPNAFVVSGYKNLAAMRSAFDKVRKALKLPNIQLRDLRRTAITEMGEASDDCMISVSGHTNRDMLNIYSLRSRHKALEAQRIRHETRNSRLNTEFTSPTREEGSV